MKILITGAAGFIGSHLYEKLKKDHDVRGIDNWFHASSNPINKEIETADIVDMMAIDELVKWCDVVYHLAAQIHVDRSIKDPHQTIDINVIGTLNVLEAVRKYNKKMVFASSSEVYGTSNPNACDFEFISKDEIKQLGMPETHFLDSQSPYAASKVAGDRLCYSYWKTYGTKVAILRNFNTFGPFQADDSYGGVIAIFVRQALSGEPITIFGDGEQERDYMEVRDALRGYELCVEKELWGRPINIGTGKTIKIKKLAEMIKEITGSKSPIVHKDPRPGEVQRLCADITMAKGLGFEPTTNFEEDLKKYINWYKL